MLGRIREAWDEVSEDSFLEGAVEVDETFIDGLENNKPISKRQNKGKRAVGKAVVIGTKSREGRKVVANPERIRSEAAFANYAASVPSLPRQDRPAGTVSTEAGTAKPTRRFAHQP